MITCLSSLLNNAVTVSLNQWDKYRPSRIWNLIGRLDPKKVAILVIYFYTYITYFLRKASKVLLHHHFWKQLYIIHLHQHSFRADTESEVYHVLDQQYCWKNSKKQTSNDVPVVLSHISGGGSRQGPARRSLARTTHSPCSWCAIPWGKRGKGNKSVGYIMSTGAGTRRKDTQISSVADPGCLSRISVFRSRDPTIKTKEKGKKFVFLHFFVVTNFTTLKIILFLNW